MKRKIWLIGLFWFSALLSADIEVISSLKEVSPFIEKEDLVLLEMDNVLLKPKEYLASTSYLSYLKEKLLQRGEDAQDIASQLYPLWVKIIQSATMQLAGADLPEVLDLFREKEAVVLGLSHRGPALSILSHNSLDHFNLSFSQPLRLKDKRFFEKDLARFFKGVLFIHPVCSKGQYVKAFLDYNEVKPKRVVLVDYELVNLVEAKQVLEEMNIPFLGFFFHAYENELSAEQIDVAGVQLKYLGNLIPDCVAKRLAASEEDLD